MRHEVEHELGVTEQKLEALTDERAKLYAQRAGGDTTAGLEERLRNVDRGIDRLVNVQGELEGKLERYDRLESLANRPGNVEIPTAQPGPARDRNPDRDRALRAIERHAGVLRSEAADRLDELVRRRDPHGLDARYLAAVASPDYASAFAHMLRDPQHGHLRFSPAEVEAVRIVSQAEAERAALAVGSGPTGGFAAPFELDPTIVLSSNGAANPLRQLATVSTISSSEWKGITSAGVTAAFSAEAAEATDNAPTLAQPNIIPERVLIFAPFSFEVGQDWPGLQQELGALFTDAKDTLEATKYLTGAGHGSNEPEGLIAGLAGGSVVATNGVGVLDPDDVYKVQEALPPRYQAGASWLSSLSIGNTIHRFSSPGGDEAPLFSDDRTRLLGKPWAECSPMASTVAQGNKILAYGDLRAGFRIVDRIGFSIELVPHLFGTGSNFPTGQRGLVGWYRTSSGVVVDNAIRVLEVESS